MLKAGKSTYSHKICFELWLTISGYDSLIWTAGVASDSTSLLVYDDLAVLLDETAALLLGQQVEDSF